MSDLPQLVPLSGVTAALGLTGGGHVAVVGGGGKSTLVHTIGQAMHGPTILTSTTKMGTDQAGGLPVLIDPTDDELRRAVLEASPVMVWSATDGSKAIGVAVDDCDRWFASLGNVVIEADGARRRPFKAPRAYEPVVPATITAMVSVIGADALGHPIVERCHRPDRVAALAECTVDDLLTPERAAQVLLHPEGARRELRPGASFSVVVTKVRPEDHEPAAALIGALADGVEIPVVAVAFLDTLAGGH